MKIFKVKTFLRLLITHGNKLFFIKFAYKIIFITVTQYPGICRRPNLCNVAVYCMAIPYWFRFTKAMAYEFDPLLVGEIARIHMSMLLSYAKVKEKVKRLGWMVGFYENFLLLNVHY